MLSMKRRGWPKSVRARVCLLAAPSGNNGIALTCLVTVLGMEKPVCLLAVVAVFVKEVSVS